MTLNMTDAPAINLDADTLTQEEETTATGDATPSKFEDILSTMDKNSTTASKAKIEKARRMEREVT